MYWAQIHSLLLIYHNTFCPQDSYNDQKHQFDIYQSHLVLDFLLLFLSKLWSKVKYFELNFKAQ